MTYNAGSLKSRNINLSILLVLLCLVSACAEFDQLMKPRVEGLQQDPGFDGAALQEGGIGESHIHSSINDKDININVLETLLIAAIREKRRDLLISQGGRYEIEASLIANDVTKRSDNFDTHIYRWTNRRVKVSYVVVEIETAKQVWSGIIETSREEVASYEVKKGEKSSDKLIDIVVAAVNKTDKHPYPSAPLFSDVAKLNFQGFALNLPLEK